MNRLAILLVFPAIVFAKPAARQASAPKNSEPTVVREEVAKMVDEEYNKETTNFKSEWERVNKRIAELGNNRDKTVADSKSKGKWESQGAELFQKFSTVITARYHSPTGDFEGGLELSQRDAENINKVFSRYLSALPLKGRVSAGEAIRFLEWGNKRLLTLSKTHLEPNEGNNSELEILAHQTRASESEQTRLTGMAKLIGIDFPGVSDRGVTGSQKLLGDKGPESFLPPVQSADSVSTPNESISAAPKTVKAAPMKLFGDKGLGSFLPPVQSADGDSVSESHEDHESKPVRLPSSAPKKKKGNLLPDF